MSNPFTEFDSMHAAARGEPEYKCELPVVPSELIRMALNDLEACERDPEYVIAMDRWHEPYDMIGYDKTVGDVCAVCFAGAVMAKTCEVPVSESYDSSGRGMFSDENVRKFGALDAFRTGGVRLGLSLMGRPLTPELEEAFHGFSVPEYAQKPRLFKIQMLEMADRLEARGL